MSARGENLSVFVVRRALRRCLVDAANVATIEDAPALLRVTFVV